MIYVQNNNFDNCGIVKLWKCPLQPRFSVSQLARRPRFSAGGIAATLFSILILNTLGRKTQMCPMGGGFHSPIMYSFLTERKMILHNFALS